MTQLGNANKQDVERWVKNRSENSPLSFRIACVTLKFRRMKTHQKFVSVHTNVHNHFSLERHLVNR